jgi:hypothetical protein
MGAQHRRDGGDTLVNHLSQPIKERLVGKPALASPANWEAAAPSGCRRDVHFRLVEAAISEVPGVVGLPAGSPRRSHVGELQRT